jgi:glycosyltransferase involved in cell wall biosynthesis
MRVLHLLDSLEMGGAEILIKGLFEHRQDHDVSLYVLRPTKNPVLIEHPKVFVSGSKCGFSLMPLFSLCKWLRAYPVDVLHCHLFRSQVFGWLLKMLFSPRVRLIFHEHGRIFGSELGNVFEDRLYVAFLRVASARVDCFIAISQATRNRLISRANVSAERISLLYNFIDPRFQNAEPNGLKNSGRDFQVGFVGRFVDRKGWRTFLDAAEYVTRKSPGFKFMVAGDGPQRQLMLGTIKEKNLTEHCIYFGQVEDMRSFYRTLDCVIVPSLWEPQGLVEIEAQASGVPVIASNAEALNEIIQDGQNGLLFRPGDALDLADKILLLQSQPDLREKLTAGGLATSREYDISRYASQLSSLYARLLPR